MLAATNAGAGNLDHFSSLQVVGLPEVKPRHLKDYADVISILLVEFNWCFQEFNNFKPQFALFATPFERKHFRRIPDGGIGFESWQAEAEVHECWRSWFLQISLKRKGLSKISLSSLWNNSDVWPYVCLWTVLLINEDQQICFVIKTH